MTRALAGLFVLLYVLGIAACASSGDTNADAGDGACTACADDAAADSSGRDGAGHDGAASDGASGNDGAGHDGAATDGSSTDSASDGGAGDATSADATGDSAASDAGVHDTGSGDTGGGDTGVRDASVGIINGGPCISGAAGATAYRVRFADAGGVAQTVYEVDGLPDHSRNHAAAYGYQIGFTPSFVDPFLGVGGLQLDSSDFVDLEISTAGLASIGSATISIFGRSFNTTTNGGFNWQTFDGVGGTADDFVSNIAPYRWYSADFTTEIRAGDNGVLVRVKAGGLSGVLVVNRIEICMQAQ